MTTQDMHGLFRAYGRALQTHRGRPEQEARAAILAAAAELAQTPPGDLLDRLATEIAAHGAGEAALDLRAG
jgi:hypothetical protein